MTSGSTTSSKPPAPGSLIRALNLAPLLVATALLGACRPDSVPRESSAPVPPSRSAIDSLRVRGRYPEALALARTRARSLPRSTPAWMQGDADREVGTLARLALLPDSLRAVAARADADGPRADALAAAGDVESATRLIERQLTARRRLIGPGNQETASSMDALARLAFRHGDYRRAHDLDREALAVRRRFLGERHPDVAESLDALGLDLKSAGASRVESMGLYRQALRIRNELFGPDSPEAMSTLWNIANMHRLMRESDQALAIFRRVLKHRLRSHGPERDQAGEVLFAMAMTLTPQGRWSEAEPLLRQAIVLQRTRGDRDRVELARSLNAHGLALRHVGRPAEAEPELAESVEIFEAVRRLMPAGTARAVQYPLVGYNALATAQLECGHDAQAWLSHERSLARNLIDELDRRGAVDTTGWWKDALARVQRALPEDAAVVGWVALRPGAAAEEYPLWCYCIRPTGAVHWHRVDRPSGDASVASDRALNDVGHELKVAAAWPLRVDDGAAIRSLGRAAYEARFAPFETWLGGVKRLVVIAPDLLHGAPVEALVDSAGQALSDRFAITYAPSALLFAREQESERSRAEPRRWRGLLIGDPATEGSAPRLTAAGDEVRDIAALLGAPTVLVGRQASCQRLRELSAGGALSRFELIHFGAHSSVDDTWLGRSAMMLATASRARAGAPAGEPVDSGGIDVDEIARTWRLDADLVTLAGCRSVLGPLSYTDGFLGLHQAMLCAGARNVVASLWPVDDRATALLMGRFYGILLRDGGPGAARSARTPFAAAEALAEARRWVRRWRAPDGTTPFAHPVYWAGFVLLCGGLARPA